MKRLLIDSSHSKLKANGYKLLWSPHWDGGTSNTPAQLATIGAYVNAGGDLFAECAAIGTLEGNTLNTTRNQPSPGPFVNGGLTSPFAQHGDFSFAGFTGAITDFHTDAHGWC